MTSKFNFETGVYRPPSEGGSHSLLLRVSRNCPWNQCAFCGMYKTEKFELRSVAEVKQDIDTIAAICEGLKNISWELGYGGELNREAVMTQVAELATPLVLLTGGEPLLQKASRPLLREMCESGKTVLLETSGERDISNIDPRVHRIMDIKTPSSEMCDKNRWKNVEALTDRDEVKFVLLDRNDYEWTRDVITRQSLTQRVSEVLLSPVHGELLPHEQVGWVLEDGLKVRIQLQLHKYIWKPGTKDV